MDNHIFAGCILHICSVCAHTSAAHNEYVARDSTTCSRNLGSDISVHCSIVAPPDTLDLLTHDDETSSMFNSRRTRAGRFTRWPLHVCLLLLLRKGLVFCALPFTFIKRLMSYSTAQECVHCHAVTSTYCWTLRGPLIL